MPLPEGLEGGFVGKERDRGICGYLRNVFTIVEEPLKQGFQSDSRASGKAAGGHCSAVGDEGFRVLRCDDVLRKKVQALSKDADERGVESERASLENNGSLEFQSLRQAADGLLGDGVAGGKGDVFFPCALQEQWLDVCLGKYAAPARYAVNTLSGRGQRFEAFRRDLQKRGDFVDEGSGPSGTAAVHTHIVGFALAGIGIRGEEDNLGVLAAQFDGCTHLGIMLAHSAGIGDDFLDIGNAKGLCHGRRPASADGG